MKWILILLISLSVFANGFEPMGGRMIERKTNREIYIGCYGFDGPYCHKASFIMKDNNGERIINDNIVLVYETTDDYYDRWYTYNILKLNASTSFSPIPYTSYIYHMQRSNRLYLKAIKIMDDVDLVGQSVELSKKYFQAFENKITKMDAEY